MGGDVVALTGATGFVGKIVLQKLLARGYKVKALVRSGSVGKTLQSPNINWIEGQLGDLKSERALCSGAMCVIHMAGLVTARTKDDYYKTNTKAVGSLTKAAQHAGVKRFIYLSSLAAKAPKLSDYAGSKRAGEGAFARNLGDMKGVVLRAPAVFGLGDKATAPFYALIRKGFLPAPGGRKWRTRKISLIYVDDLAEAIVTSCLEGAHDGTTTSFATRAVITWPEFAAECAAASGKKVRVFPLPLWVLYLVAAITSVTKRVFGIGHLTLGKLREFLYEDWSVSSDLETGANLHDALKTTIIGTDVEPGEN